MLEPERSDRARFGSHPPSEMETIDQALTTAALRLRDNWADDGWTECFELLMRPFHGSNQSDNDLFIQEFTARAEVMCNALNQAAQRRPGSVETSKKLLIAIQKSFGEDERLLAPLINALVKSLGGTDISERSYSALIAASEAGISAPCARLLLASVLMWRGDDLTIPEQLKSVYASPGQEIADYMPEWLVQSGVQEDELQDGQQMPYPENPDRAPAESLEMVPATGPQHPTLSESVVQPINASGVDSKSVAFGSESYRPESEIREELCRLARNLPTDQESWNTCFLRLIEPSVESNQPAEEFNPGHDPDKAERLLIDLFYSRALTLFCEFAPAVDGGRIKPESLDNVMGAVFASDFEPNGKAMLLSALAQALGGPDIRLDVANRLIQSVDRLAPKDAKLYKSRLTTAITDLHGGLPKELVKLKGRLGIAAELGEDFSSWRKMMTTVNVNGLNSAFEKLKRDSKTASTEPKRVAAMHAVAFAAFASRIGWDTPGQAQLEDKALAMYPESSRERIQAALDALVKVHSDPHGQFHPDDRTVNQFAKVVEMALRQG